ncbi:MAG: efflux RND transporter permease subunit [Planctomycetota bacterium]|jgi:multidrug efflux pump subunit AcrB
MFDLYFRNPRLLILTLTLIIVAGVAAWLQLPRREDPELTGRAAIVFTRFPGADAERVESLVTEKVEDELREVDEIRLIKSSSRSGISIVSVELNDEVMDTDDVWSRIRDKLDDAEVNFPSGALEPEFEAFTIDAYTLIAAVVWDDGDTPVSHAVLRRVAERLQDALRGVPGTKEADLFGDNPEEVVVEIDAEALAARGLTAAQVAGAVRGSDAKVSAGQLRGPNNDLLIEVAGEIDSLDRVRRIPVRYGRGDEVVRLEDIATVRKTIAEPPRSLSIIDGRIGVAVASRMESGLRVDQWTADARVALEAFQRDLPRGLALEVLFEQSQYTEKRMTSLLGNLGLGALLVFAVILFMMGWRSALVVGAVLPLASMMVLAGLMLMDIPLHQMSITGLIIALGLLIDSAIVMVDEVRHERRKLGDARAAVAAGVRRMAVPLLASTVTTALAFMPLVAGGGPVGEFVGPMSVAVILALASSLILAMTITPSLAGLLDRVTPSGRWWQNGFSSEWLLNGYRRTLDFLFARPALAVALALALPLYGFSKGMELEQQFFPPTNRDQFPVELRMPAQSSIRQTRATALKARTVMMEHPRVSNVHWVVGGSAPKFYYNMIEGEDNTSSYAQAIVQLDSATDAGEVIRALQRRLDAAFPEAQFIAKQIEQGPPFDAPLEVHLYGPDLDVLRALGERLRAELATVHGVTHTRATLAHGTPKLVVTTDEERANLAGFDRAGIARRLETYLEGAVGGSLLESTEELPVRVRVTGASRSDLDRIANLELVGAGGTWTPLSALGEIELRPSLADLPRRNGRRVNTVQGYLEAGMLPEGALKDFRARADAVLASLPPSYTYEFGGESAERGRAQSRLLASAGILLVLMAATLVLSFNSFRFGAIIAFVAMLCVGLAFLSLWLFGYPFGFMAIVGTMGLVGVAINDAIVVLAALRDDKRARTGDREAVREVVVRSTRHIVSTTVTTGAGFLPLILAGGGFWPPLAVSIVGGVMGATMLALYFVPAAFLIAGGSAARRSSVVSHQSSGGARLANA